MQVTFDKLSGVHERASAKQRSRCPVSISLEMLGDRWSLLIVRDLMVRGCQTFKEFTESGEGIATNILADRLKKLQAAGIVSIQERQTDARRLDYRLTEKGIALAPVILELLIWAARYDDTGAPCALIDQMAGNREQVLSEVYRRWLEHDPTPFLPKFENRNGKGDLLGNEQGSGTGGNAKGRVRAVVRRKA